MAVVDGWYHVTSRGLNRQAIFTDDRERAHWLQILGEMPERFGLRVHAYVLMDNHYHLVVQTPRANLSAAVQWLNLSYGVWFNLRHDRLGPVFNRPFKAILVEGEGHWALTLSQYVHLNPIRTSALGQGKPVRRQEAAGIAPPASPGQIAQRLRILRKHRWSSYPAYAGYAPPPEWLTCTCLWQRVARTASGGPRAYRAFVEDYVRQGQEEPLWDALQAGMVLGSAGFVKRVRGLVRGNRREQPHLRRWDVPLPFAEVIRAMEAVKQESWMAFRDRHGDPGRDLALWIARRRCGLRLRELGALAGGMDYLAVSAAIRRIQQRLPKDRSLRQLRDHVVAIISTV